MLPQTGLLNRRGEKPSVAKTLVEIRSLARSHTRTAIRVLVGIMRCEEATPAARVSAANAILDRGWGKPLQPIANEDGKPLEFIHRIERVIVRPGDNFTMEAQIEECVQRAPLSVLGSLGATNDFEADHEELWLNSQDEA